jgi:hypothetical protein
MSDGLLIQFVCQVFNLMVIIITVVVVNLYFVSCFCLSFLLHGSVVQ